MFEIALQLIQKKKNVFFSKIKNNEKTFRKPWPKQACLSPLFIGRIGSGYQSADLIPSFGVKDHLFVVIEYE